MMSSMFFPFGIAWARVTAHRRGPVCVTWTSESRVSDALKSWISAIASVPFPSKRLPVLLGVSVAHPDNDASRLHPISAGHETSVPPVYKICDRSPTGFNGRRLSLVPRISCASGYYPLRIIPRILPASVVAPCSDGSALQPELLPASPLWPCYRY